MSTARNDRATPSPLRMNRPFPTPALACLAAGLAAAVSLHSAPPQAGNVYGWGYPPDASGIPPGATNLVAISAADVGVIALRADGTVFTWNGLADPPVRLTNAVAVEASYSHALALRADGTPVAWAGRIVDSESIAAVPPWLTNVVAISAGYGFSLARTDDGFLIPWGTAIANMVPGPRQQLSLRSFSAGQMVAMYVDGTGKISGWGNDPLGLLKIPAAAQPSVQVRLGVFGQALSIREDGRVVAWGDATDGKTKVPATAVDVVQVEAGPVHSLALKADGTTVAWGQAGAEWVKPPPDSVRFLRVAAGNRFNLGLTRAAVHRDFEYTTNLVAGSDPVLRRAVVASDPFASQWFLGGQPIPGATGPELRLENVQPAHAGSYTLVTSNQFGTTTSRPITVSVTPSGPRIAVQPASQAVVPGGDVVFRPRVTGSEPMALQWFHDGTPLPGANGAVLAIANAGPEQEGYYYLVASNALGTATSAVVALSTGRPLFASQPNDFVGLAGRPATLSAAAVAPGEVAYQWWRGDLPVGGANAPVLGLIAGADTAGLYRLTASNLFGVATSHVGEVVLRLPRRPLATPALALHDRPADFPQPESFDRVVDAAISDGFGLGYGLGLKADGSTVSWAVSPELLERIRPPADLGRITAFAPSFSHALALREDGTVRAWRTGPFEDHGEANVPAGLSGVVEIATGYYSSLALRQDASVVGWGQYGDPGPALKGVAMIAVSSFTQVALREDGAAWFWNGSESPALVEGLRGRQVAATQARGWVLSANGTVQVFDRHNLGTLPPLPGLRVPVEIAGTQSRLLARSADGSVWAYNPDAAPGWREWLPGLAGAVRLSGGWAGAYVLTEAPVFSRTPQAAQVPFGATATFDGAVRSASPASFQWLRNGQPMPNRNGPSLVFVATDYGDDALYSLVASNARLSSTSTPVRLQVVGAPVVTGPDEALAKAGDTVVLAPSVAGPGPFGYQWFLDGRPIAGATTASLTLPNVQSRDQGAYRIAVSNAYGMRSGASARLVVQPAAPQWVSQPGDTTVREGAALSLAVVARGSEPLAFQWFLEDRPIPGETNAALRRGAVAVEDAGQYRVRVSNEAGSADTAPFVVTVDASEPVVLAQPTWRVANAGVPLRIAPAVAGSAPLRFQWSREGVELPDQTNAVLVLESPTEADAGRYTLAMSNALGTAASAPVQLVVRPGRGPGAVVAWGAPVPPADFGVMQDFQFGQNFAFGVRPDGSVKAWLDTSLASPALVRPPAGLSNAVAVACGSAFALALRDDGTVTAWGSPDGGVLDIPAGLDHVVAIAAGTMHAVALRDDGTPVAWGTLATPDRLKPPADATNVVAIAVRGLSNLALRRDGRPVAWGLGFPVVPAAATNLVGIAVSARQAAALRTNGPTVFWGGLTPPPSATNLAAVSGGNGHFIGLRTNGTVLGWGTSTRGQANPPSGLTNVVAVMAGFDSSAALTRSPVVVVPRTTVPFVAGTPVRIASLVAGLPPLSIQWLRNGTEMPGMTNAVLELPVGEAGTYALRVSNAWRTVVSPNIAVRAVGPLELAWKPVAPRGWKLRARVPNAETAVLQVSTDLVTWLAYLNFTPSPDGVELDVPGPADGPTTYFRLMVP